MEDMKMGRNTMIIKMTEGSPLTDPRPHKIQREILYRPVTNSLLDMIDHGKGIVMVTDLNHVNDLEMALEKERGLLEPVKDL